MNFEPLKYAPEGHSDTHLRARHCENNAQNVLLKVLLNESTSESVDRKTSNENLEQ